jgi:hypothetical protein
VLWILAGLAIALLIYEGWTLGTSVLLPLLGNPNILQTDFHYYYEAAVRFRGDPTGLYSPTDDVIAGFAYPPPAIVPFVLLSRLPLGVAFLIFTVGSYAAILGAVWMWLRYLRVHRHRFTPPTTIAVTLVVLALGPTYMNAIFGQVNAFVLACSVAFVALMAVRPMVSGSLLAIGVWLKIYPAMIVAIGAWDRRAWKAIGYAAAAAVIIVIAALPVVSLDTYESYLAVLGARFDKTALHISNQSLVAFLERFFVPPERFLNWTGDQAVTASAAIRAINIVAAAAAIAWLWARVKANGADAVYSAAALIALPAVIAPLGWGHTFVFVLPLVITHLISARRSKVWFQFVVAACVLALMIPAGRRFAVIEQLPAWAQNLAYSRYLIATMLLIALPQREKK